MKTTRNAAAGGRGHHPPGGAAHPPGGRGAATRARILQAAEELFVERGFKAATTAEIARRAGVAEGSIYRHFASKDDVLLQLAAERFAAPVAGALGEVGQTSDEEFLRRLLRERLQTARRYAPLARVLLHEAQYNTELRERYVGNVVMRVIAMGESFFRNRIEAGAWRPLNPQIALRALIGMAVMFVLWGEVLGGERYARFHPDEVVDQIVDIFLHGVERRG